MGTHVMDVRKHLPQDIQAVCAWCTVSHFGYLGHSVPGQILFFSATYPDYVQIFARNLLASKTVIKAGKTPCSVTRRRICWAGIAPVPRPEQRSRRRR